MYVVSFKVKGTNREGKYMFANEASAKREEVRLKKDKGLKSIKLRRIDL